MGRAAIGCVHEEFVHAWFMRSVVGAVTYSDALPLGVESGPNISEARNQLVRNFLATECEYLYVCDTDTIFPPNTIEQLASHGKPIVSGLILVDGHDPKPAMYRYIQYGPNASKFAPILDWKEGELLQVDAVGAGCLLVHRDVFLALEKQMPFPAAQWFQEIVLSEKLTGEDMTFCMRASSAGFELFVDTNVKVGHIKYKILFPEKVDS